MKAPYILVDVQQGSPEWRQARAGRLCASDAADMLATIKTGEAAARRDLRMRLVIERLTGQPAEEGFVSADMQRGKDLEGEAIALYEGLTGNLVQRVGFLQHPTELLGYSPDGLILDDDGRVVAIVEAKVPKSATHLKYLKAGIVPPEYVPQLTQGLLLSGAERAEFFSYDPRFPEPLRLFHAVLYRDERALKAYELLAIQFLREVAEEVKAVESLMAAKVA